jgi:hypothetical protein
MLVRTVVRSATLSKGRGFTPERVQITWHEMETPTIELIIDGRNVAPVGS